MSDIIMEPPAHLSEMSKEIWREIAPTRARSRGRRVLLTAALEALDRANEARDIVAAEGMVAKEEGSKMAHVHPALRIEKDARAQFLAAWRDLNLSWDGRIDGIR